MVGPGKVPARYEAEGGSQQAGHFMNFGFPQNFSQTIHKCHHAATFIQSVVRLRSSNGKFPDKLRTGVQCVSHGSAVSSYCTAIYNNAAGRCRDSVTPLILSLEPSGSLFEPCWRQGSATMKAVVMVLQRSSAAVQRGRDRTRR